MKKAKDEPAIKSKNAGIIVSLNILFSCSYKPGDKKAHVSLIIIGSDVSIARYKAT